MRKASQLLPERVRLPFDLLLILHWQESLHKCTGVHAAALSAEGQVSVADWPREGADEFARTLDYNRDVILFPSDDAMQACNFPWSGETEDACPWRLVVLEASWTLGKKMARQLMLARKRLGLPPLRCVALSDVVGRYWRFHEEGHASVSTIEAIYYAAQAAGMGHDADTLLLLFKLQRFRVLSHVESGGKVPRAMLVSGVGEGGWEDETREIH
jgi:DTW domain-containing protein YfiP